MGEYEFVSYQNPLTASLNFEAYFDTWRNEWSIGVARQQVKGTTWVVEVYKVSFCIIFEFWDHTLGHFGGSEKLVVVSEIDKVNKHGCPIKVGDWSIRASRYCAFRLTAIYTRDFLKPLETPLGMPLLFFFLEECVHVTTFFVICSHAYYIAMAVILPGSLSMAVLISAPFISLGDFPSIQYTSLFY